MNQLQELLRANAHVTDYKINVHEIKSYELFFVKGALETVRRTNTKDTQVTVYVAHESFLGEANFRVFPSTTVEQLETLIEETAAKASLICNQPYTLPENETGEFTVESNFADFSPEDLAAKAANTVFCANRIENGGLNSVEVFVNCHTETVMNSRGLCKTQTRYDGMVEAIPTYNGEAQSVELYEQYNFGCLDLDDLYQEISDKMAAVKARYEAAKPETELSCKVILNRQELSDLFFQIARSLNYTSVYSHSTVFQKGDEIQKSPSGDLLEITMAGALPGNVKSRKFDSDGLSLGQITIVEKGIAVNYYGSNRFGQYLGEVPSGALPCLHAKVGTTTPEEMKKGPYLEVISMSGLQVDFFSDYIGGEIRLAYYCDGEKVVPVTGISISGSVQEALSCIRLSEKEAVYNGYAGPGQAVFTNLKIF